MVRRAAIFVLAVTLIGLGPVPLSACALSSAKPAECATPATQSHCDGMKMADDGRTKVAALPNSSCCGFSNAPVLTRGQKTPEQAGLYASSIPVMPAIPELPTLEESTVAEIEIDTSPPHLQSLLCTFLI